MGIKVLIFGLISGQGGVQTHLYWLSQVLLESGSEVLIITPKLTDADTKGIFKEAFIKNSGLSIVALTFPKNKSKFKVINDFSTYIELQKMLRQFSPNIFIGIGTGWFMSIISLSLSSRTRKIFHEVMSGKKGDGKDPRWAVRYTFSDIFAQAHDVAKNFQESFGWQKPIPILPAFPEPLEITANLPQVQQKTVPLREVKAALFSRVVPHKKAFWLVQQWELLKDYLGELHIHGSGEEEILIKNYIEAQGIGDRVKCWGKYPDGQDYVNLLSSYDLTLLPTLGAEGSPLVLLESMACGVPFVAYGVGGIPDYGENNPDVMVVSPEPWLTSQAREYTTTTPEGQTKAFIEAVKLMAEKLAVGAIKQPRLQQFYFDNYSHNILKKLWLSYLV